MAVAAGLAALELIDQLDPYPALATTAERLTDALAAVFAEAGVPAVINRVESLFSVFFAQEPVGNYGDASAADHQRYARLFHAMLGEGVYLPPSGYEAWFLSTAHTPEDIDRTLSSARQAATGLRE